MKYSLLVLIAISANAFAAHATRDSFTPDPFITPGDVMTTDAAIVCEPGYTKTVRNVSNATRKKVFELYGMPGGNHTGYCGTSPKGCELDHLVSLELGGSNSIKNLFPQPYTGDWSATRKDTLENKLHSLVCSGKLPLAQAQTEISCDWKSAYIKYVRNGKPK